MSDLGVLLPLAAAATTLVLLGAAVVLARRRFRRLERLLGDTTGKLERLQLQFARFAPEEVVEGLIQDGGAFTPVRREVTVLFADLRGFTGMSAHLDPMATVTILNGYFQRMNDAIAPHHGYLAELLGDGLLAFFGALEPNPWQAQDAVLGALDMRAALDAYNAELRAQGRPALAFGVGIHSGEVVAGVIGTAALSKFGVVGDAINVASRVEGLTRWHGVDLLITDAVLRHLDGRFRVRAMPEVPVKGKEEPIRTYHVEGMSPAPTDAARSA